MNLKDWENKFRDQIEELKPAERKKAGVLLPLVPKEEEWADFIVAVRDEWSHWRGTLETYPCCLLILFGGAAFFEYEERKFWPNLSILLNNPSVSSPNGQTEINAAFGKAVKELGLTLIERRVGISYVGTAIHCIGIPISLWDDFLDVCDWAVWQKEWQTLQADQWNENVSRIGGGRRYLVKFLSENREVATIFIKEMLDARKVLCADNSLTITDLAQATLLRQEYFDAVPETAEFLRPDNPDSLIVRSKPYLEWDELRNLVKINLPPVPEDYLPATWKVADTSLCCPASDTSHQLTINSKAFDSDIHLTLESEKRLSKFRIRGFCPWTLVDLQKYVPINTSRQKIPNGFYALLSSRPLENVERVRFDDEDNSINESYCLQDGTNFFVTKLWPTGRTAEVFFRCGLEEKKLHFRSRLKVSPLFFINYGGKAANFERLNDNKIKTEWLPILGISIPKGYFEESTKMVNGYFKILMDDKPARGQWIKKTDNEDFEFFIWSWGPNPFGVLVPGRRVRELSQMGELFSKPDIKGDHIFTIASPTYGIRYSYPIYVDHGRREMENCWEQLPGGYLPIILVSQSADGMKWEDLLLARDVIARNQLLSSYMLRKYEKEGFLHKRGRYWLLGESRACLADGKSSDETSKIKYCGDPSFIWSLYRRMAHEVRGSQVKLPVVEVIDKRGEIPYLQMKWSTKLLPIVRQHLQKKGVRFARQLWNT